MDGFNEGSEDAAVAVLHNEVARAHLLIVNLIFYADTKLEVVASFWVLHAFEISREGLLARHINIKYPDVVDSLYLIAERDICLESSAERGLFAIALLPFDNVLEVLETDELVVAEAETLWAVRTAVDEWVQLNDFVSNAGKHKFVTISGLRPGWHGQLLKQ